MSKLEFLLDTNICIYIAKNRPASVLKEFQKLNIEQVGMSTITYGELLFGAERSQSKSQAILILENLTHLILPLEIPIEAAQYYADLRNKLQSAGTMIGNNDLWIASHCLALGVTLVTNNLKEFVRVPGLKTANWL